jgi:A/G-specific adenine glycosylase
MLRVFLLFAILLLCVYACVVNKRIQEFNEILFAWNDDVYRPMDWRPRKRDVKKTLDPYHILVSEIMLQQTQVDRVQTKFAQFLGRFPDVQSLAGAPLADVLSLWSGLGYNRRAKYLHQAAKVVVREYDGVFPRDFIELQKLPGVGRSTAAALMAFAWNEPFPMIDTNLRRILVRAFFDGNIPSDAVLFDFAKDMIPPGRGRAWNYAMLDLGAMVCTARRHSTDCPMFDFHGDVNDFAYKKPQSKFKGSKRSYRGALLKALVASGAMTRGAAEQFFAGTPYDGKVAIDELLQEGICALKNKNITLAE